MFQDAPIYHQLVAERGDVPARVRDAAASILRELEGVMRTGQPSSAFQLPLSLDNQSAQRQSALSLRSLPQ
ncbi:hypothetical protein ABT173_35325 [Streptomyces sp. NPDC001795]|uniref:hypothetical protein n=1 Tax=unclassified Streptomyces TaxID=2593676 RepID=UPI00332DBF70